MLSMNTQIIGADLDFHSQTRDDCRQGEYGRERKMALEILAASTESKHEQQSTAKNIGQK